MRGPVTLTIVVDAQDLDAEELDELTRELQDQLRETDVQWVGLAEASVQPGSKGPGVDVGTLLVTVLPAAVPGFIALLRTWTQRRPRTGATVRIKIKDGEVAIGGIVADMGADEIAGLTTNVIAALRRAGREPAD